MLLRLPAFPAGRPWKPPPSDLWRFSPQWSGDCLRRYKHIVSSPSNSQLRRITPAYALIPSTNARNLPNSQQFLISLFNFNQLVPYWQSQNAIPRGIDFDTTTSDNLRDRLRWPNSNLSSKFHLPLTSSWFLTVLPSRSPCHWYASFILLSISDSGNGHVQWAARMSIR